MFFKRDVGKRDMLEETLWKWDLELDIKAQNVDSAIKCWLCENCFKPKGHYYKCRKQLRTHSYFAKTKESLKIDVI